MGNYGLKMEEQVVLDLLCVLSARVVAASDEMLAWAPWMRDLRDDLASWAEWLKDYDNGSEKGSA